MKPTFKDYLSIALALLAIFLCGYGIGFLVGERTGKNAPSPAPNPAAAPASDPRIVDWDNWERSTFQVIENSVGDLSSEQQGAIRREVSETASRIRKARDSGRREIARLHERLKEHLTPEQQQKLPGPSPN